MTRDFAYNQTWEGIEQMLEQAEAEKNKHKMTILNKNIPTRMKEQPMRDYKGLQGVCNALRWVLGDKNMTRAEVLGRDER
tara:strand:+ start:906 stop:1145 length:240 start_codon:yes stop_codon:yes gene_type:complete